MNAPYFKEENDDKETDQVVLPIAAQRLWLSDRCILEVSFLVILKKMHDFQINAIYV